jgi:primosomal protein N' (replication factor Y) (superfamily II helicase)
MEKWSGERFLEVAVAAPVSTPLTYLPPEIDVKLIPGMRVLVPLGRRLVTGYLLGFIQEIPEGCKLKRVNDVLDRFPVFPERMIPFYRWVADYYQYPLGQVIKTSLPGGLNARSSRQLRITPVGQDELSAFAKGPKGAKLPWLFELISKGLLSASVTGKAVKKKRSLIAGWQKKNWVEFDEVLLKETVREKSEICISFKSLFENSLNSHDGLKKSQQKTIDLLDKLLRQQGRKFVPQRDLTREYKGAGKAVKELVAKGFLKSFKQAVYRDPFGETPRFYPRPEKLTLEQQQVLEVLFPAITEKNFSTFLVHGVTGSGKTEIYLQAAQKAVDNNLAVLLLVPEIALASQLEGHFLSRFNDQVALLHSGLSKGERFDQWNRILRGQAKIVIGARSAIFAPFSRVGLIIIDEEHDTAYKQEDRLRYQARDMAVLRGRMDGAVVILGSATPSVTSYYHSLQNKYKLLSLSKRVSNRPLPSVRIIDLKEEKLDYGEKPLFSKPLLKSLYDNLARGNQSLIFLNRRGFANFTMCKDCKTPVQCPNCQVSLTLHRGRHKLICHYCGHSKSDKSSCLKCNSENLENIGFGTEKLEKELVEIFPEARIARLDRDTTTNRKAYLQILKSVFLGEIDILVGTQMIAKGHHFPNVTLVGVVWADAGLGFPDFRAGERTFQVLSQVTGRAGREEKRGQVIVQTYQPGHYAVKAAREHDYLKMYEKEISLRKPLGFPPFSRLINLHLEAEQEEKVRSSAFALFEFCRKISPEYNVAVLGPVPSPLAKLRGKYRWQLLLRGNSESVRKVSRAIEEYGVRRIIGSTVNLIIDVDPENML